jgi:hypothetical protein
MEDLPVFAPAPVHSPTELIIALETALVPAFPASQIWRPRPT